MKPTKIAGFLVAMLLVVLLIPFLFPKSDFTVFSYKIRIPSPIFEQNKEPQYKDISQIKVLLNDSLETSETFNEKAEPQKLSKDSVQNEEINPNDSINKVIQALEFPPENDSLLNPFFATLNHIESNKQLIRILHYGDSQIEADRITAYFRNQMQKQFGGGGVGMIPITPISSASVSYVFETSGNWTRYSILNKHKTPDEPEYGVLGCFSRFNDPNETPTRENEAWIYLKNPNITYSKASKFNHCKLMFTGNRSPLYIELKKNEDVLDADIFPSGNNVKIVDWHVETGSRNLLITLKGKDSPDIYGLMLDNDRGIAVDNIPLRGSSGLEFTRIFRSPFHKVLNKLNVKLIILQFGVNAVINMSTNIGLYERSFLNQLLTLRESQPEIPIIVIGVNDISKNTPEGYVTNDAVEKIRDAQKRAAFKANCVFWDMYEGMGGKNSMPSWVFANPSLAQKDFLHLNPLGARIIGEMFYRSLMNEYSKYLSKSNAE